MLEMCFVFTLWSVKGSYKDREKGAGAEGERLGSRHAMPQGPHTGGRSAACPGTCQRPLGYGQSPAPLSLQSQLFVGFKGFSVQRLCSEEPSPWKACSDSHLGWICDRHLGAMVSGLRLQRKEVEETGGKT